MSSTGLPVLELDDVTVRHDGRTVLRVEHLVLDERRIGVVGANGSGKSTLLRLLDGLVAPDTGRVRVAGLDTVRDGREVRRRVGFCFQEPADQIVMPVVADDIAFGLKNLRVPTAERDVRVAAVLDRFGIGHLAARAAATLSGGEKQTVALAAVLVVEPTTVLFDEPTGTLDLARSLRFAQVLGGLDVQAVVATHDLDLLDEFDRVLVLDDGQIVADDPPGPALAAYRRLAARTCAAQPCVEGRPSGATKPQVRPSSRASSLAAHPDPDEPCALGVGCGRPAGTEER